MFCLYVLCLLFALANLGEGSGPRIESQTVQNFEVIRDDYLSNEKSLWNIIRSSGAHREDTLWKIYETHKKFMGKNFGEIGLLRSVSKDLSVANRTIIYYITNITQTFEEGYNLLYNGMYDRLESYTARVIRDIPFDTVEVQRTILDRGFWNAVKNVCIKC